MSRSVPIESLPTTLRVEDAVNIACAADIAFVEERLRRGISVLVECDKELALYLYLAIRDQLKSHPDTPRLVIVDGRERGGGESDGPRSNLGRMLDQLTEAVRGSVDRAVIVLLHLDVLTTTHTGLTVEAREAIPLLYENPEAVLLGFRDPTFEIPKVIEEVFATKREIVGVPRESLPRIITQREARTIQSEVLDPYTLYKYVSGLNPVRCRRLFDALTLRREASPGRPNKAVYRDIRRETAAGGFELPDVDLQRDVAGYEDVKTRLDEELIALARRKDAMANDDDIRTVEELLPRGVIFHGPPGTGKTFFAKAIATALDATALIVSGPELKSKWVGESEENLRRLFRQARHAAPSVIVFDEIDAFASSRGRYEGSGVEHSMVNQLLTEMDGFRKNEMVFVVGTTNFLTAVDSALLRPGRFEFLIEVPAPGAADREAIARLYDKKFDLGLDERQFAHIVRRTVGLADAENSLPFTGDHLFALFRALKRQRLRTGQTEFSLEEIDRALARKTRRDIVLSDAEERVIAVHESGHALLALLIEKATPPERIAIAQDQEGALGYVMRAARTRPYALTASEMRADVCVGLGGTVAERLVFGEASIGAYSDLQTVGHIARAMVEEYGMDPEVAVHVGLFDERGRRNEVGEKQQAAFDAAVDRLLREEMARAERVLTENRALLDALVALLLEHKVLSSDQLVRFAKLSAEEEDARS